MRTSAINEIRGFDEFFQVWGAEDDDLNDRLVGSGLNRVYVNCDEIPVYHQWHQTSASLYPNLWYLKMVEYLYGFQERKNLTRGYGQLIDSRPALREKGLGNTELVLKYYEGIMVFNEVLLWLVNSKSGESMSIDQKITNITVNPLMKGLTDLVNRLTGYFKLNIQMVNKAINEENNRVENTSAFFNYFIGTNRDKIEDYYYSFKNGHLTLRVIKK